MKHLAVKSYILTVSNQRAHAPSPDGYVTSFTHCSSIRLATTKFCNLDPITKIPPWHSQAKSSLLQICCCSDGRNRPFTNSFHLTRKFWKSSFENLQQWFPKYGSRSKQGWQMVKKWVELAKRGCWHWKRTWQLTAKNHPHNHYFFLVKIRCLRLGWRDVHQTQIWVALKKVGEPLVYSKPQYWLWVSENGATFKRANSVRGKCSTFSSGSAIGRQLHNG